MSVCDVPIISSVCDVAGEAAATVVAAPFDWLAQAMGGAAGWLIEAMWAVFDTTTFNNVGSSLGCGFCTFCVFWLAKTITVYSPSGSPVTLVARTRPDACTWACWIIWVSVGRTSSYRLTRASPASSLTAAKKASVFW